MQRTCCFEEAGGPGKDNDSMIGGLDLKLSESNSNKLGGGPSGSIGKTEGHIGATVKAGGPVAISGGLSG